jgi:hypothetical protein
LEYQPHPKVKISNSKVDLRLQNYLVILQLDEVQKIPLLFEQLKYVVDKQKRTGGVKKNTFILTGSSQLILLKNIKETLAGRASLAGFATAMNEGIPFRSSVAALRRPLDRLAFDRFFAARLKDLEDV